MCLSACKDEILGGKFIHARDSCQFNTRIFVDEKKDCVVLLDKVKLIEICNSKITNIDLIRTCGEVINRVKATAFFEDKDICTGITVNEVITRAANDCVVSGITRD